MAIMVEVSERTERDVVIRLGERQAKELMYVVMFENTWDESRFEQTLGDFHTALEDAGIEEA